VIEINPRIASARSSGRAIVALESTVLTHGLPRPANLELGRRLEAIIRDEGAEPATVGVLAGRLWVGLDAAQMEMLALAPAEKASLWNLAALCVSGRAAGTTVATTLHAAAHSGIALFATGGIGGVHHEPFDESADLLALARYPVITVSSGPKSVLDVPATLERLETLGVPVIGWRSDHLAGFHVSETDLRVPTRVDDAATIAAIHRSQRALGLGGGMLISQGVENGLDRAEVSAWIAAARRQATRDGVRGQSVTPALLRAIAERSGGATVDVNLRLLEENARLAARIAVAVSKHSTSASEEPM
jgi:pseudouridine-5'-phosphate glycosidase